MGGGGGGGGGGARVRVRFLSQILLSNKNGKIKKKSRIQQSQNIKIKPTARG